MRTQRFKITLVLLFVGLITVTAQKKLEKKYTERFTVNKDVVIDIDTRYTDIEIETWNKNEVVIDAYIDITDEVDQKLIDDFGWSITDAGKAADCIDPSAFITTWKTDNPGGSEGSCSDGHNFGLAFEQTDTWVDGPTVYQIQFSGFFSDTTPPILTGTFWSIEGGNTSGYVGVSITPKGPSTATIGNRVWQDINNNGVQDSGEPGAPSVTVELYEVATSTLYATTTTDASGAYVFINY